LNTPRAVTNQQQQLVWRWENTEPFGNSLPEDNPSGLGSFEFPLRFPGTYADRETGLFYNYFRDYDPQTGRYIQPEPLGIAGDINLYRYARNNPLTYIDPDGQQAIGGAAGGGATGGFGGIGPFGGRGTFPGSGGGITGIPEIDEALGASGRRSSSGGRSSAEEYCPPGGSEKDRRCEQATADAERLYNELANDRIPTYLAGGSRGADKLHYKTIQQKQTALQDAVRRVKLYCKPPPPELPQWEALANQSIARLH